MKILILENEQYQVVSSDGPKVGRTYYLEDATTGTGAQNRAFHALLGEYWRAIVQEFWKTGQHSYGEAKSLAQFKELIKRDLGAGFESYVFAYIDGGVIKKGRCKTEAEIPAGATAWGKLKSWSKYTLKERRETMDRLISEMMQAGVNTKKFNEILEGMEGCTTTQARPNGRTG